VNLTAFPVNWHCKPLGALDWNGSGMHATFPNSALTQAGSKEDVLTNIAKSSVL
jgi:hypothetical protein